MKITLKKIWSVIKITCVVLFAMIGTLLVCFSAATAHIK